MMSSQERRISGGRPNKRCRLANAAIVAESNHRDGHEPTLAGVLVDLVANGWLSVRDVGRVDQAGTSCRVSEEVWSELCKLNWPTSRLLDDDEILSSFGGIRNCCRLYGSDRLTSRHATIPPLPPVPVGVDKLTFHMDVSVDGEAVLGERLAFEGGMLEYRSALYPLSAPINIGKASCHLSQTCTCVRPCIGLDGHGEHRGLRVGLRLVRGTDIVVISSNKVRYVLSPGDLAIVRDEASSGYKRNGVSSVVMFSSNVSEDGGPTRIESRGLELEQSDLGMKIRVILGQRPVDVSIQFPVDLLPNGECIGLSTVRLSIMYGTLVRRTPDQDQLNWRPLCYGDDKIDSISPLHVLGGLRGIS